MVSFPEKISIKEIANDRTVVLELSSDPGDLGKIIGKQGKTVTALRNILKAASIKSGKRVILKVVER